MLRAAALAYANAETDDEFAKAEEQLCSAALYLVQRHVKPPPP